MQPSQPPPPYDALFSASNPFPTDARLPPEYSDVSSVPAAAALSWAQITAKPPPPSSVQAQREQNGNVASYDERLNAPDELWRFLVQHAAEAPILELEIEGWDTETMYQPRDYNDNEVRVADATGIGQTHTPRFWIAVDLSSYLAQAPSRILDVKGRPIAAAIDDYALSTNQLKELVLTKQIVWDFEELKRAVYGIVRQAGWDGLVDIRLKMSRNKVYARSGSTASQAKNDPIVQALCFITCLWICAGPAAAATEKKVSSLVVEYPALAPVREFYNKNYYMIADAVRNRVQQRFRAWN